VDGVWLKEIWLWLGSVAGKGASVRKMAKKWERFSKGLLKWASSIWVRSVKVGKILGVFVNQIRM
jgi:hypothetical protein